LVTGLFTDTKLCGNQTSATAVANATVFVTLDGNPVAPATNANPGIIFDSRFQQLNSNLTAAISTISGGPGVLTVEQVKNFSQNSPIVIQ